MKLPAPLWLTGFWIALCAYFNCVGWILSAAHQLNATGYAVSLALGILLLLVLLRVSGPIPVCGPSLGKLRWRAGRSLSAVFFLAALLVLIGGVLYSPNNYDALTYRFPRVLHWLAEGQWHWIDASDRRVNLSAAGFEWLMTPLFALTNSNRCFFLINLLSYLLLPGLVYSTFVRLGISKRVAWYWMWLIPCGYCFVLQAASIGNDSFAAVYLLAALCFGLRAKQTSQISDIALSILAAALLTGAKASNLPLLLPCFLVLLPSLRLIVRKPLLIAALIPVAAVSSFLPIAAVNAYYTGDWTGDPTNASQMKLDHPVYGVLGNALQLVVNNVQPPVMPFASAWNRAAPKFLGRHFPSVMANFPQIGVKWGELSNEEGAGIGLGITAMALISVLVIFRGTQHANVPSKASNRLHESLICWSSLLALGVLMAKFGNEGVGRIIAPYYPIVIACVLLPGANKILVRQRWWRLAAMVAAIMALPCVILTPSRPLFPAQTLLTRFSTSHPQNRLLARGAQVYWVYGNRADGLAPIRKHLPQDAKVVGFIGADDPEVALWRPFGSRSIKEISGATKPGTLPRIVVASNASIQYRFGVSIEGWIKSHRGKILARENIITKIAQGPQDWYVIRLGSE